MLKGDQEDPDARMRDAEFDDDASDPDIERLLEKVERFDRVQQGGARRQLVIRRQLEDLADHRRFKELFDEL